MNVPEPRSAAAVFKKYSVRLSTKKKKRININSGSFILRFVAPDNRVGVFLFSFRRFG